LRGLPAWLLKGSAICLTVLATVGSAAYVGSHVRNQGAPLRPSLQPGGVPGAARPGAVNLAPGMRATLSQPVTETHVS
jgi:hypothetical protein